MYALHQYSFPSLYSFLSSILYTGDNRARDRSTIDTHITNIIVETKAYSTVCKYQSEVL